MNEQEDNFNPDNNKPSLLIVDDNKNNLIATRRVLQHLDINIHTVLSGEAALKALINHPYFLILMDVQMPDLDGFETVQIIRDNDNYKNIPIIFLTAVNKEQKYILQGYKEGAVDYIQKPFDRLLLTSKVDIFLELYNKHIELQREKNKIEITLSTIPDPLITLQGNQITYINDAAHSLLKSLGYKSNHQTLDELFYFDLISLKVIQQFIDNIQLKNAVIPSSTEIKFDSYLTSKNYVYEFKAIALPRITAQHDEVVLIFHDISSLRSLSNKLSYQAFHDPLTNCLNRLSFENDFKRLLKGHSRRKKQVAVVLLDLDDFKTVNDTSGHAAGDKVLCMAVERFESCLREEDLVYRLGGDEFGILMPNVKSNDELKYPAQRLINAFDKPFLIDGHEYKLGISIGITSTIGSPEQPEADIIINADFAMYEAKKQGKNRFVVFTEDMRKEVQHELKLNHELVIALDNAEFRLFYQPQVNIETGDICGMEALIRWHHPQKGIISPALFLPTLESTGLIKEAGKWVIEEACRQIAEWQAAGFEVPCVSVNISPSQFTEEAFPLFIEKCINKHGINAHQLVIEITETLFMESTATVESNLNVLHEMGFKISLDDFGTGYSALSYLIRFPIDELKIDQVFIQGMQKQSEYRTMVSAIINMTHGLHDMKVVCEGVEDESTLKILSEMGADIYQGYYFDKPMPAKNMSKHLKSI